MIEQEVENRRSYKHRPDDEISLVDLAATFIRRRNIFYVVFLFFTAVGVAYALLATEKYDYVSLVQAAQRSGGAPIEAPATTIATLESRWLPEVQALYRAEHERSLPFRTSFGNPDNTTLLRLDTESAEGNAPIVETTHTALIEKVRASQNAQLEKEKKSLERQISSLDKVIESLQDQQDTGEAIAAAIQKRVSLESQLEQLEPLQVLVVSRQSAEKTGPSWLLIVVMAALFGGVAGVFLAFMAEFWGAVKSQLVRDSDK